MNIVQRQPGWCEPLEWLGYGGDVTSISEKTVIDQALAVIDVELKRLTSRDMVTASDVTNLLLDLRLLLAPAADTVGEPVTA